MSTTYDIELVVIYWLPIKSYSYSLKYAHINDCYPANVLF